ncbi:MAG: DUF3108 domain-containing protein, partial [bacterium]
PCLPVRDRTQTGGRISVSFPSSKSELHSDGILETVESPRGEHTDPADTCSPSEGDGALPLRRLPNNAFRVGERLVFSVEYGPFKAGQATMEVLEIEEVNGRRCYHLISEARTSELFSSFFEVRDRVESYMDVDGLFPWRFEKHLREGSFRSDMRVEYGQVNHVAVTDKDTMKVPPFVQDILSGFYYGRLQELKRGESIFIDHHSGRKIYPLEVKVLKRERVKVPAGVFKCMVIEPVLQAVGIFKHAGRLRVWLTDDERKIPVLMKSKMIIGSVAAKLVEYDLGGEE